MNLIILLCIEPIYISVYYINIIIFLKYGDQDRTNYNAIISIKLYSVFSLISTNFLMIFKFKFFMAATH